MLAGIQPTFFHQVFIIYWNKKKLQRKHSQKAHLNLKARLDNAFKEAGAHLQCMNISPIQMWCICPESKGLAPCSQAPALHRWPSTKAPASVSSGKRLNPSLQVGTCLIWEILKWSKSHQVLDNCWEGSAGEFRISMALGCLTVLGPSEILSLLAFRAEAQQCDDWWPHKSHKDKDILSPSDYYSLNSPAEFPTRQ